MHIAEFVCGCIIGFHWHFIGTTTHPPTEACNNRDSRWHVVPFHLGDLRLDIRTDFIEIETTWSLEWALPARGLITPWPSKAVHYRCLIGSDLAIAFYTLHWCFSGLFLLIICGEHRLSKKVLVLWPSGRVYQKVRKVSRFHWHDTLDFIGTSFQCERKRLAEANEEKH